MNDEPTVDPLTVSTPAVVAGELIEAAWGNQVRADLQDHEAQLAGKYAKTGGVITGLVRVGDAPASDLAGVDLRTDGVILSAVTFAGGSVAATSSLVLNRVGVAPGPADVGGVFVSFRRGAANQTGSITIGPSTSTTAYNTTSDERLKDEIGPVPEALDRLLELRPIRFAWKADGYEQDGFLAHEVQTVVPEAVTGERGAVKAGDDPFDPGGVDPQQLDASKLVPLLVAAVQALAAQVAELSARLEVI